MVSLAKLFCGIFLVCVLATWRMLGHRMEYDFTKKNAMHIFKNTVIHC